MTLFSGVDMEPFQAECEDPGTGEEPAHQPSVGILAQAQQGGCPFGPCVMSAPNASAASDGLVLFAYRWPRTQPASDPPKDIVALGKDEYQHGGWEEALEEVPPSDATAATFFRITATAKEIQRLAARAAGPTACREGRAMVAWSTNARVDCPPGCGKTWALRSHFAEPRSIQAADHAGQSTASGLVL